MVIYNILWKKYILTLSNVQYMSCVLSFWKIDKKIGNSIKKKNSKKRISIISNQKLWRRPSLMCLCAYISGYRGLCPVWRSSSAQKSRENSLCWWTFSTVLSCCFQKQLDYAVRVGRLCQSKCLSHGKMITKWKLFHFKWTKVIVTNSYLYFTRSKLLIIQYCFTIFSLRKTVHNIRSCW